MIYPIKATDCQPIEPIPSVPTLQDERDAEQAAREAWVVYLALCHRADEIRCLRQQAALNEVTQCLT